MGIVFGLAWTPCLTPTFGTVLALAATQGTAGRGTLLTVAYCVGLGVPFVLVAAGVGWVSGALEFVRRHGRLVGQLGGGLLVCAAGPGRPASAPGSESLAPKGPADSIAIGQRAPSVGSGYGIASALPRGRP